MGLRSANFNQKRESAKSDSIDIINISYTNANRPSNSMLLSNPVPSTSVGVNSPAYETKTKLHYLDFKDLQSLLGRHSRNFLRIGLHNARSLVSNIDNYRSFFLNSKLNVFAIVETWLKPIHTNKSVELEGYKIIRSDRNCKRKPEVEELLFI